MRRVLVLVVVLLGAAPALQLVPLACGDKFLMVGRSLRFNQVYAAIYPSMILIYAHSAQGRSSGILDPKFQANLIRAGHRVEVVKDDARLAQTLQDGGVDLVLADVSDVEAIKPRAELSPSKPMVLPLLYKPTRAEAEAVKTRYRTELKSSDRPERYLSAIDHEMQARAKARPERKTP